MISRTILAGLGLMTALTAGSPPPRDPPRAPDPPAMADPAEARMAIGGFLRLLEPLRPFRLRAHRSRPVRFSGPCSPGNALVIGDAPKDEIMVIDHDTTIVGNICIVNQGELRVEGAARLTLVGDITVQQGGALTVDNAGMTVLQEWTFQFRCLLLDSARLEIRDSDAGFNGQNWGLTTAGTSTSRFENSTFPAGHASMLLVEDASMEIVDCRRPGEFIPMERSRISVANSDSIILWFNFPDSSGGDLTLPGQDSLVVHWEYPGGAIHGIDVAMTVDSTSHIIPGILGSEGIDLTVRDSDVAAFGLVFWEGTGDTVGIAGLVNDTRYSDFTVGLADRALRLLNTRIGAWNYYPFDDVQLRVENSIFGEILASDSSRTEISTSICDGTGGFVSADGRSEIVFTASSVLSQAITRGRSLIVFIGSGLPTGRVSAEGSSAMLLIDTPLALRPTVADTASMVEAAIGLPSITPVDASIPVTGTALITPGPFSPLAMDHYRLDYAAGVDPAGAEWTRIDSVSGGVLTDTLGVWDTTGLEPGPYLVQLTVVSEAVDTFRLQFPTIKAVVLTETVGIGPGVGEGGEGPAPPVATGLRPNAPNPFNPRTEIRFGLREAGSVRLRIYDIRGRAVRTLVDGPRPAGIRTVTWDGTDDRGARLPSGVYFCRMEAAGGRFVRKMVMTK